MENSRPIHLTDKEIQTIAVALSDHLKNIEKLKTYIKNDNLHLMDNIISDVNSLMFRFEVLELI